MSVHTGICAAPVEQLKTITRRCSNFTDYL
uniref:Uncharacterized protein n=1 Tax=Anguilla anguilla TaxID=7936 RepID=A0A0E9PH26_ANGAN